MRAPSRTDSHRALAAASGGVRLAWVVTEEDGLRHVSQFVGRARPKATCPVCARPVRLRLGKQVAHHAAHAPASDPCPVSAPETALHFNLKCHIHAQLEAAARRRMPLQITEQCVVGNYGVSWERRRAEERPKNVAPHEWLLEEPCTRERSRVWLPEWDEVELERRVPCADTARIPDIVLRRAGKIVAAIEVFHSSRVDDVKAADLAAAGLPWIEVRADPSLLGGQGGEGGWTIDVPLPVHRASRRRRWRCPPHAAALREAIEELESRNEAARHTRRVCAVKIVDLMYPSSKRYRNIYAVKELSTDGVPHSIVLVRGHHTLLKARLGAQPKRAIWTRIDARVEADLAAVRARRGAHTDCPMEWALGALAELILRRAAGTPFHKVPLEQTHPTRYLYSERNRQWFVPSYLEGVRWDRAEDDPLAEPHQAWHRHSHSRARRQLQALAAWPDPRRDLMPADFGGRVYEVQESSTVTTLGLRDYRGEVPSPERIVVLCKSFDLGEVRRVDAALVAASVERLWVSHPKHWSRQLDGLPWFPAVRAGNDHAIPVNGCLVELDWLAEAFADGDPEASPQRTTARHLADRLGW